MKTIDICGHLPYSPLIPAIKAICNAQAGEELKIITDRPEAFNDLKEYLSECHIGFREIYEGEKRILEFTIG